MKFFCTIRLLVVLSFTSILFAAGQTTVSRGSSKHDLMPLVKSFSNYNHDFRAMSKPLSGEDREVVDDLERLALTQADRLHAANAALQMYDAISSEQDRSKVKRILKEKLLKPYPWVFDKDITRINGVLSFAKVPAAAQMGLRMKDDMRTAKEKIDAIIAFLGD